MAIYDELRAKGDAFFSERFEGFWIMTRAELMREVLDEPLNCSPVLPASRLILTRPSRGSRCTSIHRNTPSGVSCSARTSPPPPSSDSSQRSELVRRSREQHRLAWECDFVADFAREYPTTIFMGLMGTSGGGGPAVHGVERRHLELLDESDPDMSNMMAAMYAVNDYFAVLLKVVRQDPADDLVSAALTWRIDGQPVPKPIF